LRPVEDKAPVEYPTGASTACTKAVLAPRSIVCPLQRARVGRRCGGGASSGGRPRQAESGDRRGRACSPRRRPLLASRQGSPSCAPAIPRPWHRAGPHCGKCGLSRRRLASAGVGRDPDESPLLYAGSAASPGGLLGMRRCSSLPDCAPSLAPRAEAGALHALRLSAVNSQCVPLPPSREILAEPRCFSVSGAAKSRNLAGWSVRNATAHSHSAFPDPRPTCATALPESAARRGGTLHRTALPCDAGATCLLIVGARVSRLQPGERDFGSFSSTGQQSRVLQAPPAQHTRMR